MQELMQEQNAWECNLREVAFVVAKVSGGQKDEKTRGSILYRYVYIICIYVDT